MSVDLVRWPHDEGDCHGSLCADCGCCMHSESCAATVCHDTACECADAPRFTPAPDQRRNP